MGKLFEWNLASASKNLLPSHFNYWFILVTERLFIQTVLSRQIKQTSKAFILLQEPTDGKFVRFTAC